MGSPLRIARLSLLTGARQAEGIAVVIDVLRAFTCTAFMTQLGAEKIVLLAEPEAVLKLKEEEGCLAVGEVDGRMVPGFDLGNSPSHILAAGRGLFAGRVVAQRTSAGVAGAVAVAGSSGRSGDILLGSYVTAGAIARYIRAMRPSPPVVSLVAMGSGGREITPDDEACADYIEHLLTGRPYDHAAALQRVVDHECTKKFLRGDQAHYPASDPIYCLQRDLFDFVFVASLENGRLVAKGIDVPTEPAA
ncbi:MAG: 2-phosphosulfolactate phosphatase [Anaerolineae bacterium]|jgi:2-phosphosulfolactate phosphatase